MKQQLTVSALLGFGLMFFLSNTSAEIYGSGYAYFEIEEEIPYRANAYFGNTSSSDCSSWDIYGAAGNLMLSPLMQLDNGYDPESVPCNPSGPYWGNEGGLPMEADGPGFPSPGEYVIQAFYVKGVSGSPPSVQYVLVDQDVIVITD